MSEIIVQEASVLGAYAKEKLLPAVIILAAGILVIRLIMRVLRQFTEKSKLEKAAHSLIYSLASFVMYLLLGLITASALGIDVSGIIALASVLTLAVSLSVQNALTNVIGGFTLLYTHPFKSGDYVDIGSRSGTVSEIGMTYTRLITFDSKTVVIPNSTVISGDIVNYTAAGTRRVDIPVSAPYEAPVQKVLDALLQAATIDEVLLDPAPEAVLSSYGESAVNYELHLWTKAENYWKVKYTVNERVPKIFMETGIRIAYPQLRVHIENP